MGGKNDSYSFWEIIFFQQNRMKKTKTFFFVILNLIYLHIMWHARYRVIRAFLQKIVFENKIIVVQFLKINKNNVFFWCERFKNVSLGQKKPSTWPTKHAKQRPVLSFQMSWEKGGIDWEAWFQSNVTPYDYYYAIHMCLSSLNWKCFYECVCMWDFKDKKFSSSKNAQKPYHYNDVNFNDLSKKRTNYVVMSIIIKDWIN